MKPSNAGKVRASGASGVERRVRCRWGTTRTVLLIGRWAVKVPSLTEWRLFLLGLLANMQEACLSRCGWPELCPVTFSIPGGWLIVMHRAEPITRDEFFTLDVERWRNRDEYTVPVEAKLDSFGRLNGSIVAIDYGS